MDVRVGRTHVYLQTSGLLLSIFPTPPQTSTSPPHKSQQNNKGKKRTGTLSWEKIPTWAGCWQSQCKFYLRGVTLTSPKSISLVTKRSFRGVYYWHQHWGPSGVYLQSTSVYKEPFHYLGWRHQFSSTEGPPGILAGSVESQVKVLRIPFSSHPCLFLTLSHLRLQFLLYRSHFHSQRPWCQGLQ